jgi:hypothetical protein
VQTRLPQLEPVGLHRHRLLAAEELHDRVERFVHPRRWVTGSMPSMYASETSVPGPQPSIERPRVMIELDEALRHQQGWW